MKLIFLEKARGSENGIFVRAYEEGEIAEVTNPDLIRAFVEEMKVARPPSDLELMEAEPEDDAEGAAIPDDDSDDGSTVVDSDPEPADNAEGAATSDDDSDDSEKTEDPEAEVAEGAATSDDDSNDKPADLNSIVDSVLSDEIDDGFDPNAIETPEGDTEIETADDSEVETPAADTPETPEKEEKPETPEDPQPSVGMVKEGDLLNASGKPYKSHGIAMGALKMRGLSLDDHKLVEVPNGYVIRPKK